MTTTVINIKDAPQGWETDPLYTFIGRRKRGKPGKSVWGNPFRLIKPYTMGDRFESIEFYANRIRIRRREDRTYDDRLQTQIKDHILVCFCAPLPCHGNILADLADGKIDLTAYTEVSIDESELTGMPSGLPLEYWQSLGYKAGMSCIFDYPLRLL